MSDNDILTAPPEQHLHDLRAVHDMGNLHIEPSADAGDHPWSVLRLAPAPNSGSTTLVGAAIDGKTGELIDAATGKPAAASSFPPATIVEGSWELVSRIGAPPGKKSGRYQWTEPHNFRKRQIDPDDIYRPFGKGGVILCRQNPQADGVAQFDSVNLLPTGWERDVAPAFDALKKNKALSGPSASTAGKASLQALLTDKNAIVSSMAFRSLAESGSVDTQVLEQGLSQATGYLRAVMIYVTLVHPPNADPAAVEPVFARFARSTSPPQDQRAAALAFAAAALFHPAASPSRSLSVKLLSAMRAPAAALANQKNASRAQHQPDPYVEKLIQLAQVP